MSEAQVKLDSYDMRWVREVALTNAVRAREQNIIWNLEEDVKATLRVAKWFEGYILGGYDGKLCN